MIRLFALCSATILDDNRVCLSGIDTEKFFPVICFAKFEDLRDDLKVYLSEVFSHSKRDTFSHSKRDTPVNVYRDDGNDIPACIEFRFCLTYVFYKCKDGKFRTYLR